MKESFSKLIFWYVYSAVSYKICIADNMLTQMQLISFFYIIQNNVIILYLDSKLNTLISFLYVTII